MNQSKRVNSKEVKRKKSFSPLIWAAKRHFYLHLGWAFPLPTNPVKIVPPKCALGLISWLSLDSVKLTTNQLSHLYDASELGNTVVICELVWQFIVKCLHQSPQKLISGHLYEFGRFTLNVDGSSNVFPVPDSGCPVTSYCHHTCPTTMDCPLKL